MSNSGKIKPWNQYHALPRVSYYLFLRNYWLMPAWKALAYLRRVGVPPVMSELLKTVRTEREQQHELDPRNIQMY